MNQYEVAPIQHDNCELNTYYVNSLPAVHQEPHYNNSSSVHKEDEGNFFSYIVFAVLSLLPMAMIYNYTIPYFESLGSISIIPAIISCVVVYALIWIIVLKVLSFIVRLIFNIAENIYHHRIGIAKAAILLTVIMFICARIV